MIVTDKSILKKKCKPVEDYEEAEKIITVQSAIDYMTNIVGENA